MILNSESHKFRARRRQRGQVLPIVAIWLVFVLGMAALAVDLGNVYCSYRQLQSATDAAALAGASALSSPGATSTTVTAAAIQYSALVGDKNYYPNLQNIAMRAGYPQLNCLSSLGIACPTPADANAVTVKTQATVPLYFASIFGFSTMNISTEATAAMRGAPNGPFNVVIILDTTASMASSDGGSECSGSRISCALSGVQTLLEDLSPCSINLASCGTVTAGNVTNPVDQVSLMVFPAVTAATASDAYCTGGSPSSISTQPYGTAESPSPYPLPGGPSPNTYQIVPFSSDYKSSDTVTTLTATSNLVKAVGGASGCAGLYPKGGAGTYYAGVIYAAQASLVTQQLARPTAQNVIIILSDGDANAATPKDFAYPPLINGKGTNTNGNNLGTYMSNIDQCQQAVVAAQAAAAAGTTVYSVSYGSEASGCTTDTTNLAPLNMKGITPCQTMQYIASDPTKFFSDYKGGGGSGTCVSASQPVSNLNQIFGIIAADLTHARLIPVPTAQVGTP